MPLEPIGDKIIVKRLNPQEKIGSIHLPEASQDKPTYGTIIAVSRETKFYEMEVIGVKILFGKYSGLEVEHNGEKLLILREEEIIAIVRD